MSDAGGSAPLVTVVVPARNEERAIEACLAAILRQSVTNLEVLVVDGASEDATAKIVAAVAAKDDRVRCLSNAKRTIPRSLNIGLAAARGRWLVRVDAHSEVPDDYVATAVRLLEDGRWGGVGGRKDGHATSVAGQAIAAALGSRFGVGDSRYHYAEEAQEVDHVPFGAYPVSLCRALGGWDERLTANEDYEFDYRLRQQGHRLLLHPGLRIAWHSRETVSELARQYFRYGKGKADVARLHPRSLQLRHLAAPALTAELVAATALFPLRRRWALAMVTPYAAAVTFATLRTGRPLGVRERAYLPAAFAAMHIGWGAGFWTGLVGPVVAPR